MKNLFLIIALSFGLNLSFAQDNLDVSTLRIGAFTINMNDKGIEKITGSKSGISTDENNAYKTNKVAYSGETIELTIAPTTNIRGQIDGGYKIYSLKTKSKKFRTKSGIGVGSTKDQLLETYKNFPNFSVNQMWDDKIDKFSTTDSQFLLKDYDAGTILSFGLRNNMVTEISVYIDEGC